jgi:allantoate deiminase
MNREPIIPHNFQQTFEARIEALGRISEAEDNLVRPSFTPAMRQVNTLVGEWMRAAGMTVREDNIGNLIGRYESSMPNAKTLVIGSHLDTVKDAGRYDGTLGVLLGLACVEALAREGRRLPFAIEVIAFSDEEGLRFHLPYLGSKTIAGVLSAEDLQRRDENGISIRDAVREYGGNPDLISADRKVSDDLIGYLEVHIEQGPLLESLGLPIGIVTAIAGMNRVQITFKGEAGHAGTVPMHLRRDTLVAAAKFIAAVEQVGLMTEGLVATVGQIEALPGASNAIPGKVTISLDVRHQDDTTRLNAVDALYREAQQIGQHSRVDVAWEQIAESMSIPCSPQLIEMLSQAAEDEKITPYFLSSGAGHDAVQMSRLAPSAMIFVRCRGGISHNPAEYASSIDAEAALKVLIRAVTGYEQGV